MVCLPHEPETVVLTGIVQRALAYGPMLLAIALDACLLYVFFRGRTAALAAA